MSITFHPALTPERNETVRAAIELIRTEAVAHFRRRIGEEPRRPSTDLLAEVTLTINGAIYEVVNDAWNEVRSRLDQVVDEAVRAEFAREEVAA